MKLWILALMMLLQPGSPWISSYESTVEAIEKAATENPIYKNDSFRTAALLVAIGFHESIFNQEAVHPDKGGDSIGLFQVNVSNLPGLGMTRQDLLDPYKNAKAALVIVRWSLTACRKLQEDEKLSLYTGGPGCDHGRKESRDMTRITNWLLFRRPPVYIETNNFY